MNIDVFPIHHMSTTALLFSFAYTAYWDGQT